MAKRKLRKCSYRTFQINTAGEVWLITQDSRRKRSFRTGERYLGCLHNHIVLRMAKQMGVALIIRVKKWKPEIRGHLSTRTRGPMPEGH